MIVRPSELSSVGWDKIHKICKVCVQTAATTKQNKKITSMGV